MKQSSTLPLLFILCLWPLLLPAQRLGEGLLGLGNRNNGMNYRSDVLQELITAERMLLSGNYEIALTHYDNAIALQPNLPEGYIKRAIALMRAGRRAEAEDDYRRAVALNPYIGDLMGYNGPQGKLAHLAIVPQDFLNDVQSKLLFEPYADHLDTYWPIEIEGDWLGLSYTDALPLADSAAAAWDLRLALLLLREGRAAEAETRLRPLAEEAGLLALVKDLLGLARFSARDYATAGSHFEAALAADPDFSLTYYNLALLRKAEGRYREALALLDKALALQPALAAAWYNRGWLHKHLGNYEEAINSYTSVIRLEGKAFPAAYLNRGIAYKLNQDAGLARADFDRLIAMSGSTDPAYFNARGTLNVLIGEYLAAIEDFSIALDLDGDFAEAYYNRGLAHVLNLSVANGCQDLEQAQRLGMAEAEEMLLYLCNR